MKVKSIRGSIKYNAAVFDEGQIFEIEDKDFNQIQENVEIIPKVQSEPTDDAENKKSEDDEGVQDAQTESETNEEKNPEPQDSQTKKTEKKTRTSKGKQA